LFKVTVLCGVFSFLIKNIKFISKQVGHLQQASL
jgi:hypothetical protein